MLILASSCSVVKRKGAHLNARKLAMYLAVMKCKKISSLAFIAAHFEVGINGISSNKSRCDRLLLHDNTLKKQLDEISQLLVENTETKV